MDAVDTEWFGAPLRPLAGGYSGETFLVGDETADDCVVLRIYARQPERCVVDASLLRLVHGILPVPTVLDARPPHGGQPGVLVTTRLPGVRLDLLLAEATPRFRAALGVNLGHLLARLSGIPMLRFGMFRGADLQISTDALPPGGLAEFAQHFRDDGRLAAWTDQDWSALVSLLDDAETLLEDGRGDVHFGDDADRSRRVLVHSDFNPKNLLVDDRTGEVTGLLDWEFAHAGSPYADLGNLTRFERQPELVDAVVASFLEGAPALAADPVRMARAVDLWALVELAGGSPANAVRELATRLLLAQARSGDLNAWPWDSPRVDPLTANAVP